MNFAHAFEQFRKHLRQRKAAERTVENHVGTIARLHRELRFDEPGVEERIAAWHRTLIAQYEQDHISGAKVRNDVLVLSLFYDLAVEQGHAPTNPVLILRWPGRRSAMPKRERWRPRPMSMDDVQRLLTVVEPVQADGKFDLVTLRDRVMIELFLNGLRRVEVCRLNDSHIVYDGQQETLVVRVWSKGGSPDEPDDVPLHPHSAALVALWLLLKHGVAEWPRWVEELERRGSDDRPLGLLLAADRLLTKRLQGSNAPLFYHNDQRMTEREVNRIFAKHRDAAGLDPALGPHSLRHTCATELLEQGVDSRVVQQILRHASIATTQVYMDVRKGPKARAMRRLPLPASGWMRWTASTLGSRSS